MYNIVVNDLASIARKLPRMPIIETIAILRHKNTKISKDYTYRPFKIITALTWLKKNNHLYEKIKFEWPNNTIDWHDKHAVIETPYIELTDDEENEINEQNGADDDSDGTPSTNPGMEYTEILNIQIIAINFELTSLLILFYLHSINGSR